VRCCFRALRLADAVGLYVRRGGVAVDEGSVATRELSREVALNGVAFPSGRAAVWPAVSGRVVRVLVSRGDYVTENQPLLELDDVRARRDVETQQ